MSLHRSFENEDPSEYVPGACASGHNGSFKPWVPDPVEAVPCPAHHAARLAVLRAELLNKAVALASESRGLIFVGCRGGH